MSTTKQHRSFWPIAIIGWFLIFIVAIVIFVGWAVRQPMDLVQKDYYAEEVRFQRHIDRVQRTARLSSEAVIHYDYGASALRVSLPPVEAAQHLEGFIHFYRPSDAALDQNVKLSLDASGKQLVDVRQMQSGLWKVRLFWKLNGEEYYSDHSLILGANHS